MGKPAAIPADEMTAAEARFAAFNDADERSTKWRRENYIRWRTGWNNVMRRYQAHHVRSHDEVMGLIEKLCGCLHDWQNVAVYDSTDKILGTYERGSRRECSKCHERDVVITSRNNWSGD